MITIQIPNNNLAERRYAIDVVFGHFLGLSYELAIENIDQTVVRWGNATIEFPNALWRKNEDYNYLSINNIPQHIQNLEKYNIPVLYGDGRIVRKDDSIYCGVDIFASVFFMLTRWEEYVNPCYDKYGRFQGKKSIAYQYGFLDRPIVNEYIEMLWKLMTSLGYSGTRKKRKFAVVATHDIDHPYMRYRILRTTKQIVKAALKFDYQSILEFLKNYFRDPYDNYSFFMDVSESCKMKSRFYFMSASPNTDKIENRPYKANMIKEIVSEIIKRGHIVGFHPGVFAADNGEYWTKEKMDLEEIIGSKVKEGRHHYLKISVPTTFAIWEKNDMKVESSLAYYDVEGFRCGTGDEYPVFNFLERKQYNLIERPLVIMDATLVGYKKYSIEEISKVIDNYLSLGKKYNMKITILFHNSSFLGADGIKLRKLYSNIFSNCNK